MKNSTEMNDRYLAHHVIYRGIDYPMSIVELRAGSDNKPEVIITPFVNEIHSTVFYSGRIVVNEHNGSCPTIEFC